MIVDGIKIDTTLWIDPQTARFRDQSEPLNTRRKKLSKEIVRAKAELKDGEEKIPAIFILRHTLRHILESWNG